MVRESQAVKVGKRVAGESRRRAIEIDLLLGQLAGARGEQPCTVVGNGGAGGRWLLGL